MKNFQLDLIRIVPRFLEAGEDLEIVPTALPLEAIDPHGFPPIRPLNPVHVEEIKESLRALRHLLHPLVVLPKEGRYVLLDGQHRFQAVRELVGEGVLPRDFLLPAVVVKPLQPNAEYIPYLLAFLANRLAAGLPRGVEALHFLRYAERVMGVEGAGIGLVRKMTEALRLRHLEAYLDAVYRKTNPVDPWPLEVEAPPDLQETMVRAAFYWLEAFVGEEHVGEALGILEGFLRLPGELLQVLLFPKAPEEEEVATLLAQRMGAGLLPPERVKALWEEGGFVRLSAYLRGEAPPPKPKPSSPAAKELPLPPPSPSGVREFKQGIKALGKALALLARNPLPRVRLRDGEVLRAYSELYAAFLRLRELLEGEAQVLSKGQPQGARERASLPLDPEVYERIAEEEGLEYE